MRLRSFTLPLWVGLFLVLLAAPMGAQDFVRGDCNIDGQVSLNDILYLFCPLCDPGPPCLDACDTNDDGNYDITDGIYLLQFLFTAGDPPPFPFPGCGADPTSDALTCGTYDCTAVPPPPTLDLEYTLDIGDVFGSPGETIRAPVTLDVGASGVQTWSFGVAHDPTALQLIDAQLSPGIIDPDYSEIQLAANGWTMVTFMSLLTGGMFLDPGLHELAGADYTVLGDVGDLSTLDFAEDLTTPGIPVEIAYSLTAVVPVTIAGWVSVSEAFRRGDSNQDGFLDIADPIFDLHCLFLCLPPCLDALDNNDDGLWNIADPIFSLLYLFQEGDPPAAPFLECGADPTEDSLPCDGYSDCP